MADEWVCWKCGAAVADQPLPLARTAVCGRCRADLHVCRQCEFHDPRIAHACREPIAEAVQDKERANFCGYFSLRVRAYRPEDAAADAARGQLDALFGGAGDGARDRVDGRSEADIAKERLEQLFNNNGGERQ